MEMSELQIAKLVLGYLKIENCHSAYSEFINTSNHLKEFSGNNKRKYMLTRFLGQSLSEILMEYTKIYTIVQERLEDTDYFKNHSYSGGLIKQLIYLLDNSSTSRCSTPISSRSPENSESFSNRNSSILHSHEASSTPLHSLPGHNESSTPKRKTTLEHNRSHRVHPKIVNDDSTETDELCKNDDEDMNSSVHLETAVNVFAQTLLVQKDLQEKIAQNINTTIRDIDQTNEIQEPHGGDCIDSAIKAVLEKTESDPVFESLMGEIIGSVSEYQTNSNSAQKTPIKPSNTIDKSTSTEESRMEDQNNSAINSIVSAGQLNTPLHPNQNLNVNLPKTDVHQKLTVNTNNNAGDIILFEGSFDNYMKSTAGNDSLNTPTPQIHQPVVSNLLMVKPATPPVIATSTGGLSSYLVLNSTPMIKVAPSQPTQPQYVLTEQDIMAMPTVIVCEDKKPKRPVKSRKKDTGQADLQKLKTLLPKNIEDQTKESLSEYMTFYKSNELLKETPNLTSGKTEVSVSSVVHIDILPEAVPNLINLLDSDGKKNEVEATVIPQMANTPEETVKVKKPVSTSGSSGSNKSHVRALDFKFNTPVEKKPVKNSDRTVKKLFNSPTKVLTSWDASMRELAKAGEAPIKLPSPKRKRKPDLNKTEDDAKKIEEILTADLNISPEQNKPEADDTDTDKKEEKRKKRKCTKTPRKIKVSFPKAKNKIQNAKKNKKSVTVKELRVNLTDINKEKPDRITVKESNNLENNDKSSLSPEKNEEITERTDGMETKKILTPEDLKVPNIMPISTVKRNSIPVLETPVKEGTPKTPGILSPEDTPITKVFKEHMEGLDISSIQTPKFPLTPNFPFTPFLEGQSPASNRPTDYSTSSSYYQPSDSEQNKSLELEIRKECIRLESVQYKLKQPVADSTEKPNKAIADKLRILQSNVIGKKNLNLLSREEIMSDSESEASSEESNISTCSWMENGNNTIVHKPSEVHNTNRYMLRSNKDQKNDETTENIGIEEEKPEEKEIKEILGKSKFKPELHEKKKPAISDYQTKVLKELEEKRKRTIAIIKNKKPDAKKEAVDNMKHGKKKETVTPKMNLRSKNKKNINLEDADTIPLEFVETEILIQESKSINTSPIQKLNFENIFCKEKDEVPVINILEDKRGTTEEEDAERLINGLGKMGIHLIPNKTPVKQIKNEPPKTVKKTKKTPLKKRTNLNKETNIQPDTNSTVIPEETKEPIGNINPDTKNTVIMVETKEPMSALVKPETVGEVNIKSNTENTVIPEKTKEAMCASVQNIDEDSTSEFLSCHTSEVTETFLHDERKPHPKISTDIKLPRMIKNQIEVGGRMVDIFLTYTPYIDCLSLPFTEETDKTKVKILNCYTIPKRLNKSKSTLTSKESTAGTIMDLPLEDLYSSEKLEYNKKKTPVRRKSKAEELKKIPLGISVEKGKPESEISNDTTTVSTKKDELKKIPTGVLQAKTVASPKISSDATTGNTNNKKSKENSKSGCVRDEKNEKTDGKRVIDGKNKNSAVRKKESDETTKEDELKKDPMGASEEKSVAELEISSNTSTGSTNSKRSKENYKSGCAKDRKNEKTDGKRGVDGKNQNSVGRKKESDTKRNESKKGPARTSEEKTVVETKISSDTIKGKTGKKISKSGCVKDGKSEKDDDKPAIDDKSKNSEVEKKESDDISGETIMDSIKKDELKKDPMSASEGKAVDEPEIFGDTSTGSTNSKKNKKNSKSGPVKDGKCEKTDLKRRVDGKNINFVGGKRRSDSTSTSSTKKDELKNDPTDVLEEKIVIEPEISCYTITGGINNKKSKKNSNSECIKDGKSEKADGKRMVDGKNQNFEWEKKESEGIDVNSKKEAKIRDPIEDVLMEMESGLSMITTTTDEKMVAVQGDSGKSEELDKQSESKRKAAAELIPEDVKKFKPDIYKDKDLIKNLNVEDFLSKIHGYE